MILPLPSQLFLGGFRKLINHLLQCFTGIRMPDRFSIALLIVIRHSGLKLADQLISILRNLSHLVAILLHMTEKTDDTCRGVKTDSVSDTAVAVGIIGKYDGDPFF